MSSYKFSFEKSTPSIFDFAVPSVNHGIENPVFVSWLVLEVFVRINACMIAFANAHAYAHVNVSPEECRFGSTDLPQDMFIVYLVLYGVFRVISQGLQESYYLRPYHRSVQKEQSLFLPSCF